MSIYETVVYFVLMATMPGEQPTQIGNMYDSHNMRIKCEMDKRSYSTSNVPYVLECKRKEIVREYECNRTFDIDLYKGCEQVLERKPNGEVVYGIHWKHVHRIG